MAQSYTPAPAWTIISKDPYECENELVHLLSSINLIKSCMAKHIPLVPVATFILLMKDLKSGTLVLFKIKAKA